MPEYRGPNNGLHAEYGGLYIGLHGVVWRTTLYTIGQGVEDHTYNGL